jgi:very-short-patch-repair endonuclease
LKLVIEVDGCVHREKEVEAADMVRQRQLELEGLRVIRFTNDDVLKTREVVIEKITLLINELS